MIDSCSERKLDPGLAAMYSKPRNLRTSTMKSDPGWSAVITSTDPEMGPVSAARAAAFGTATPRVCACWALARRGFATRAAAPAAALFRKLRRPAGLALDFAISAPSDLLPSTHDTPKRHLKAHVRKGRFH